MSDTKNDTVAPRTPEKSRLSEVEIALGSRQLPSYGDWDRYSHPHASEGMRHEAVHTETGCRLFAGSDVLLIGMIHSRQQRYPHLYPPRKVQTSMHMAAQPQYLQDWVIKLHPHLQRILLRAAQENMHHVLGIDALSHNNVIREFCYGIFNRYPGDQLCDPKDDCNLARMLNGYIHDAPRLPISIVSDLHLALCIYTEYGELKEEEDSRRTLFLEFRGDLERRFFLQYIQPSMDILPYLSQENGSVSNFGK